MIKRITIVVVALLATLLLFATTRPDNFRVQRATSVKAPPEKIFPLISDFRRWDAWSPYEHLDPAMKRSLSGATEGKGAVYEWEGNDKVGKGRMEITRASPPSKVAIQLDFIKPIEGHDVAEFTLQPQGDATQVTWTMYGRSPYVAKLMGIFFDMDSMVGKEFETGLANLKALAEK